MGYHLKEIKRGKFGEFTKITEEYEEWQDAFDQGNPIMELVELADLIGAIFGYAEAQFNISQDQVLAMVAATKRAFEDGTRNPRETITNSVVETVFLTENAEEARVKGVNETIALLEKINTNNKGEVHAVTKRETDTLRKKLITEYGVDPKIPASPHQRNS